MEGKKYPKFLDKSFDALLAEGVTWQQAKEAVAELFDFVCFNATIDFLENVKSGNYDDRLKKRFILKPEHEN